MEPEMTAGTNVATESGDMPASNAAPPAAPLGRRALAAVLDALLVITLPLALWTIAGLVYSPIAAFFLRPPGDSYDLFTGVTSFVEASYEWTSSSGLGFVIIGACWVVCGVAYVLRYRPGATRRSFGMRYTGLARTGARATVLEADVPTLEDGLRRPTIQEADGVPTATVSRRFISGTIDAVMMIGAPPWWVLMSGPLFLVLPELLALAFPLLVVGMVAWSLRSSATRSLGIKVATVGQLLTGLIPVADDVRPRLVRFADVPGARALPRWRLLTAASSLAVASIVTGTLVGAAGLSVVSIVFQEQIAAQSEQAFEAGKDDAEKAAGQLCAAALRDPADGGADMVTGRAVEQLPRYRARISRLGVTGWTTDGWGGTSGGMGQPEWEFMKRELVPAHANDVSPPQVSIVVKRIDDRMMVTQITWSGPDEAQAP